MGEGRLAEIEDLLIDALSGELPGVRVETRTVSLSEEEMRKSLTLAPFVLIEYNGGNPAAGTNSGSTGTRLGFNLFVGAKSLRSRKEAQRGSYQMLSTIRETLDGQVLSNGPIDAGPFEWEGESIYLDTGEGTIYQAIYSLTE